ncbi:hypothetical protein [Sorangium sp. So ce406]|uniref:hypothetical protein n=1 Tax=Sorangium sp. So ce406 TaxID=3133311 RepID=UPI003F5B1453
MSNDERMGEVVVNRQQRSVVRQRAKSERAQRLAAVTAGLLLAACGGGERGKVGAEGSVESAEQEIVVKARPDTSLATLRLSATHKVEFVETDDGAREVHEELHADLDSANRKLADYDAPDVTMEGLYRYLAPEQAVPAALVDADARAAARVPTSDDLPPPAGDDAISFDGDGPLPPAGEAESAVASEADILWDWEGDKQWFFNNYCNDGDERYCAANAGWVHVTKKRWTNWWKAAGFNQAFDAWSDARFIVERSRPCGFLNLETCWDRKVDTWIDNRKIRTYFGEGGKYRRATIDGAGANHRVGLAVRWKPRTSGGAPTPPPTTCGGHNQFACSSGQRCQSGLVEYNYGCYGCGVVGLPCCKDWSSPIPTPGGVTGSCIQGYCGYPGGYCQ